MTTKYEDRRVEMAKYFKPENASDKFQEHLSPDGKFKLVIRSFSTKEGCWSFTQGLVYRVGEDHPLFEVQRNYHQFPFTWIDHPNGHPYLICGEDYQGSTVLELDTGKRKDSLPEEAKQGWGFCWVKHRLDAETKILTVLGCCWACPYEFRFYDFSDPMNGWPVLECDECCYEDGRWPTFEADGTIQTYSTETEDDDDEEEGAVAQPGEWRATKIFRREGPNLILVREDVSEEERVHREQQAEYRRLYDEKMAKFKAEDPLYLAYIELVKDPALSPEDHCGIGVTHDTWCPHFKVQEQRYCRNIVTHKGKEGTLVNLEWGMQTGPIKLVIYKDGSHVEDKWFEHSVEGMQQAFQAAKEAA
jgi:hypothetical protein